MNISTFDPLSAAFLERLAEQSVRAGARLSPQRKLAEALNVSRDQVRAAIDDLVEIGVLTKRNGSGVYVRKRPTISSKIPREAEAFFDCLTPEVLLAGAKPAFRLKPVPEKMSLRLGLWWHGPQLGRSSVLFHQGVRSQAEELGHSLVMPHIQPGESPEDFKANFHRYLGGNPCDGHLVLAKMAPLFLQWQRQTGVPAVFTWMGSVDSILPEAQPLVWIDLDAAYRRSMEIFARIGYRKVGVLIFDDREPDYGSGLSQYRRFGELHRRMVEDFGFDGDLLGVCSLEPKSVHRAVRSLFETGNDLEAVYIADDVILPSALNAMKELGLVPGENVAVITLSIRRKKLPSGIVWSRMEFNPFQLGRLAVQSLVRDIESHGEDLLSFSHQPHWIAGKTHLLPNRALVVQHSAES